MSLIDEALKRAQAAGQGQPGRPADRPWIPTPMPDAGLATRRRLLRVAGACGAAAVLLATALFFWKSSPRSTPEKQPERPPEAATAAAVAADRAAMTSFPAPPTAVSRVKATPSPAAAVREVVEALPAPARTAQTLVGGRNFVGSIALPDGAKLELGGIVWSETEPRALLNDRIVAVGAYVEGFTVAKIEEDRIELEKDGVTVFLSVK